YFGGAGTFAGFTAETSNPNDTLSSGTLTFTNQVNSLTACTSIGGASSNNINSGCSSLFALTNVAPGVFGGTAQITLQNTGSLSASKLYLWAPWANGVLQTGIANGATVNSLSLSTTGGPPYGTQLNNFNPITHNPFCQAALFYVQEIGTNHNYCWVGSGAASANGMCNAPISTSPTIGANTTIGTATYTVTALRGNVKT